MRGHILSRSLLFATACTASSDVETVYDPCSPMTIAVVGATENELRAVEHAVATWGNVLPVQIALDAGPPVSADTLAIAFRAGDSFYRAIYFDEIGTISISRDRLSPDDYALAVAHELGHAFGLLHVDPESRASVMNVGNLTIAPTTEDAAEVANRWPSCER